MGVKNNKMHLKPSNITFTHAPVLAFANFKEPFILHTDASTCGLGAALYQYQADGKQRVVAFASRGLNKSERNYPAHKLEFSRSEMGYYR